MASTYKKLRIAFFLFSAIGLILYITAFSIPKWSTHESGSDGLWQICYINGGSDTCALWPDYLKSRKLTNIDGLNSGFNENVFILSQYFQI